MPFLSWKLLKELLPLIYQVLMHLLQDPKGAAGGQQRAELLARLASFEGDVLEHVKGDDDEGT